MHGHLVVQMLGIVDVLTVVERGSEKRIVITAEVAGLVPEVAVCRGLIVNNEQIIELLASASGLMASQEWC